MSMTSTPIDVIFFTKANLCCCTNFLSIKHAMHHNQTMFETLLSWIMTNNKKLGLNLKTSWDPSQHIMYQSLISRSLLRMDVFIFRVSKFWVSERSGLCCMWFFFFGHSRATLLGPPQYKQILFFPFSEGFKSCFINLHGIVFCCWYNWLGWHGGYENFMY